jgi:hypothetical protein
MSDTIAHAQPGDIIELNLMLRNRQGQVVGGRAVLVNVV